MLRCAAVHGFDPGRSSASSSRRRSGLAGEALRAARPVVAERLRVLAPSRPASRVRRVRARDRRTDGVGRRDVGRARRRLARATRALRPHADLELLDAFASLASLALRNAESFADRSRQARVQRGFYRIATLLGEPVSLAETYDAAAQAAAEALGGDCAAVLVIAGARARRSAGGFELPDACARSKLPPAFARSRPRRPDACSDRRRERRALR